MTSTSAPGRIDDRQRVLPASTVTHAAVRRCAWEQEKKGMGAQQVQDEDSSHCVDEERKIEIIRTDDTQAYPSWCPLPTSQSQSCFQGIAFAGPVKASGDW